MAARRNRRGRRRNRGRFSALYKLLSVLIIFAAILMGCVVFFRVSTVEITGDSPYTEEEIRRVSGVEQGDNLFTLNKYQISSRIYTQLPYIGTVNFERKYPDTFVIHVTASVPVAWIESVKDSNTFFILNSFSHSIFLHSYKPLQAQFHHAVW